MNKDVKIGLVLGAVILLIVGVHLAFNRSGNSVNDDAPVQAQNRTALPSPNVNDAPVRSATLDPAVTEDAPLRIDPDALASARVEPGLPPVVRDHGGHSAAATSEDIVRSVTESLNNGDLAAGGDEPHRPLPAPSRRPSSPWPTFEEINEPDTPEMPVPPAGGQPADSTTPPTPPAQPGLRTHTVVQGDVLSRISRRYYGTQKHWRAILDANRDLLKTERDLRPDMVLIIPHIGAPAPTVIDPYGRTIPAGDTYKVERGDTFWSIAEKRMGSGTGHETLYEANRDRLGLKRPTDLKPGMEIVIPRQTP